MKGIDILLTTRRIVWSTQRGGLLGVALAPRATQEDDQGDAGGEDDGRLEHGVVAAVGGEQRGDGVGDVAVEVVGRVEVVAGSLGVLRVRARAPRGR
jgi:hypothetical protein